ncbi:DUF1295 domain-containing protein [Nocardia sp. CS682]|uniref:DUF1295 domain-containing protein n=1 Tax=Nocardia sp. CS682 TaxID=1047172 RepID=UPI00143058F0|nr:DUF1295 domain-containing protein [Nocardia sp. CS682]
MADTPSQRPIKRFSASIVSVPIFVAMLVDETTRTFAIVNAVAQLTLFLVVACLPAWRTLRMSYVDIAWPWGLTVLGVQVLVLGELSPFTAVIACFYLVVGGRMGLAALTLWRAGEFDKELPRYRFQRLRWKRTSLGSERVDLVAEVLVQGWANCTVLAVPAALAVSADKPAFSAVTAAGFVLWACAWALESTADMQKLRFGAASAKAGVKRSCDAGLWKYSRHPNYFFQWLQWTAVVVMCLPELVDHFGRTNLYSAALLAFGLVGCSVSMYWCLVSYTGAIPAEYYSVQKRPDYRDYQARTNMFFPGPARTPSRTAR